MDPASNDFIVSTPRHVHLDPAVDIDVDAMLNFCTGQSPNMILGQIFLSTWGTSHRAYLARVH